MGERTIRKEVYKEQQEGERGYENLRNVEGKNEREGNQTERV